MQRQPRPDNAETILDGLGGGPRPAPAPERIGAYRLEERLGIGGMGEVFRAWDEKLQRRVAVKRIRQDIGMTPEQRERFRREARLAARLSHPNVVQIHDLVSDGTDDAIVMELLEGRTVEERLAAGRLETTEVLRLALEIAEGLAAAHEAGLVHRDLKAANILVTRAGHAKILDFGLARPVARAAEDQGFTRQGVILGTCHAMSPEQARGEEVDERSDLFSFGALVHEMLAGRPPFRGNDPIDSLRRVVTEEAVDPRLARPDLPAEAACLLRRLLAKNRDDRPADAREVIEILERLRATPSGIQTAALEGSAGGFSSGAATQLEMPGPFSRKAPILWARRHLPLVAAVILCSAMALALLVATWVERRLPGFGVLDEDYFTWMEIQKRIDQGNEQPKPEDLARIKGIVQRSPGFFEAQLLGARIARNLFASQGASADLESAYAFLQDAKRLAPRDSRPLVEGLYLCRARQNTACAEAILKDFETLRPNVRLLKPQALVAASRDDWAEAATLLAQLVERSPTRQNLYQLASAEVRCGKIEAARQHFEDILREDPENCPAREGLASLELWFGDPVQAEENYDKLAVSVPDRAWNNLGTVRLLRGNLEGAETAYTNALQDHPDHVPALVNLAEVERNLGKRRQAEKHYLRALDRLQDIEAQADLSTSQKLYRAQCLARLRQPRKAVEIAQALSSKITDNPSLLYQSALVYSLAGDRAGALANMTAALDKGVSPHWFEAPAFAGLRALPR